MIRPMRVAGRLAAAAVFPSLVFIGSAIAADNPPIVMGPTPWAVGMQAGFSPVKRDINALNHLVFIIIALISALVGGLLAWVIYRYNAKRSPQSSTLTHNTTVEVLWTVLPILILVLIAIPSFRLVYYEDRTDKPDMTIKVIGHQWYWEYSYPDLKNLDFSSYIVPDDKLKPGQPRLLTVDKELVLPVGKNIRILATSGDVIHSFFIPSLGVQRYAIPGRTIETWVRIDQPGLYYGECNQVCGTNHSRMPIAVRGLTPAAFQNWVVAAQKEFSADATPAGGRNEPVRSAARAASRSVELASATQIDITAGH